ncbi:MAG TPA: polyprenyl synthetase family protein [Kineosporiaceae bacterium]|nr:polyprenyl synthetase family protein [Kineosporiaceae bacterium]
MPATITIPSSTMTGGARGPAPDRVDAEGLRTRVTTIVEEFLARQADVLDEVSPDCGPLVGYVADLMRGGKRLRPAFCYWGWRGAGAPDGEPIVAAASALEFFQAAALIHDDVMDDSDTRRGAPAVHRRFATLHRGGGWAGDGARFGLAGAVLAGDLCLVWSDQLFTGSGLDPAALSRARRVFDRMRTELMGGQYLDMLEQAVAAKRPDGAFERARRVIRYKSAKYTIEQPLLLGGRLAGADEDLLAGYSAFGLPLGEAFQLRDDVLGVFGDPSETGKPAGDDLREGKRTMLIAKALAAATPAQAALVNRLLGDPALDATGVGALREVIVETGALAGVEALVDRLVEQASAALAATALAAPARPVLERLVSAATARAS